MCVSEANSRLVSAVNQVYVHWFILVIWAVGLGRTQLLRCCEAVRMRHEIGA